MVDFAKYHQVTNGTLWLLFVKLSLNCGSNNIQLCVTLRTTV